MGVSTKNLFSIILIISVVFILFLSSPVYKIISGEGSNKFPLIEGMTSSEASSLGLTGDGSSNNPYIIPQQLIIRPRDSQWKQKIQSEDKNEIGNNAWSVDDQFKTEEPEGKNQIGNQYRYFAEWWLAKYNPKADTYVFFAANVRGNNYSNTASDYGLYKFVITGKDDNDRSIKYSGLFNGSGWGWTSQPLSPAPTPVVAKTDTLESYGCTKCSDDSLFACTNLPQSNALKSGETIPAGTPSLISNYKMVEYDVETPSYTFGGKNYWWRQRGGCPSGPAPAALASAAPKIPDPLDKAKFASRKCNSASTRDGNCIPVCVPLNMQKVSGPAYGDPKNAMGPDGQPFNQNTANYFYEKNDVGSGGEYYPITDVAAYGSATDCMPKPNPAPSPSPVGGGCDRSCTKVKDPRFAKGACKLDKSIGKIVCSACPKIDNGEIDCNNFRAKCSGCGANLRAYFDPNKQPYPKPGPRDQPYTPTECESNCKKPGVEIFKNYLNTFRDGGGFDDQSCQIIGRNMVKCKPVLVSNQVDANGGSKPFFPSSSECILCEDPGLQGYATFERSWDDKAKQNDYKNVKLVDGPPRDDGDGQGGGDGGDGRGSQGRRRGANYGPSDGSGSGSRDSNWGNWDGGGDNAGWRRNRGSGCGGGAGWYQSLSDVKSKSFQVAAANAMSSRQQAYIESLKLELNKVNDEYTTQQVEINKMKAGIDKMVSACQTAKSKLSDAMRSSVSDNMNKNAAITMKEKVDANANTSNIAFLKQNVKSACDNSSQMSDSYNYAMKQLTAADAKRQALIEKLVVAMDGVTENKTTININVGGGGGMGDCGDRLGCGTGIRYNNMYTGDYFKPQHIDDMINNVNVPMPYQDMILF